MAFLIIILVMGFVLIYVTSRGTKQRQAQASRMQNALVTGAEVRTIGGLVGEVVEVTDEHVIIETTPGTRLKFVKSAVAGVIPPAEEPEESEDEAEEDGAAASETDPDAPEGAAHEPSDEVPAAQAADEAEEPAESEPAKR